MTVLVGKENNYTFYFNHIQLNWDKGTMISFCHFINKFFCRYVRIFSLASVLRVGSVLLTGGSWQEDRMIKGLIDKMVQFLL